MTMHPDARPIVTQRVTVVQYHGRCSATNRDGSQCRQQLGNDRSPDTVDRGAIVTFMGSRYGFCHRHRSQAWDMENGR